MVRTSRKSQNSEVLVARTCKTYENRVFLWPEHVENLKISMFWWPEHETTMNIASSCGQNIENLWTSRLSWVSCPISVYGLLSTQLSDKYLYLYLAQLKPFKRPTFLASCLLLLQAALPELDRLLLCLAVSAVLNSLLLHFAVLKSRIPRRPVVPLARG